MPAPAIKMVRERDTLTHAGRLTHQAVAGAAHAHSEGRDSVP
jgi:hypothetical protein